MQRFSWKLAAAAMFAAAVATSPALADKPKKDLTDAGYSCVRVSVNFIECTKTGSPTYWCDDAGNCQQKVRVKPGADAVAPKKGVLEVRPNSGGGNKGSSTTNKAPGAKSKN